MKIKIAVISESGATFRTLTIEGLNIHEPEWFPEKRKDIADIWFAVPSGGKARRQPKMNDYLMVKFICETGEYIWEAGPIVEFEYDGGELVGSSIFQRARETTDKL